MTTTTTNDLIRAEIDRLHRRGSADWQSLFRQAEGKCRPLRYNLAQLYTISIPKTVNHLDLEWGRGTGKTTVFGHFIREIAGDMPRAVFQFVVPTYQKFLTEIIPSLIHSLEMQGMHQGLHYFVNQRPPRAWNWPMPYKPPTSFDHFISFYNGFGIHLLSQDIPGAGRGLNTDGEFADESAMLSIRKMEDNSTPAIRGSNLREFADKRWFDFRLKASSTPLTPDGAWFIEREEMARNTPNRHVFIRANCICNAQNLKKDYLTEARRTCTERWVFEAEYLNIRPRFTRNGFYALLDEERHAYTRYNYAHYANTVGAIADCRGDDDLTAGQPLILGADWGAAINSLVVCQHVGQEFRALKNFFVLGADGDTQDELFRQFHEYYRHHNSRDIYFWYDATGNAATGNTKLTRAQQAEQQLRELGWTVRRMTVQGTNPRHFEKYQLWERIFQEADTRLPRFRMNRQNCKELWVSMANAGAKMAPDGSIKKDKRGERSDAKKRQYATDLSDAMDQPVFGMFNQVMKGFGASIPEVGASKW